MEKKSFFYFEDYIYNGHLQHDFAGIEPGTIVGVELFEPFTIKPGIPSENEEKINYIYYLDPIRYGSFNFFGSPKVILMEVIDEHTGKELYSGQKYLVGDEYTDFYIEKDLHKPNVTEEYEQELFNSLREQPIVLNPIIIKKIQTEEEKQFALENNNNQEFNQIIPTLIDNAKEEFDQAFANIFDTTLTKFNDTYSQLMNLSKRHKFNIKISEEINKKTK